MQHCFAKLLSGGAAKSSELNSYHSELVAQAIKSRSIVPEHLLPDILVASCTTHPATAWTEHRVAVVQAIIDASPQLETDLTSSLAAALHQATASMTSSVKLGKLLLSVAKKYGVSLTDEARDHVRAAATANGTFMAKPILQALAS